MKTAYEIIAKHFDYKEFFDPSNEDDLIVPADKLINAMEEYAQQKCISIQNDTLNRVIQLVERYSMMNDELKITVPSLLVKISELRLPTV